MDKDSKVEIERDTGWADKYCSYVVYIDGKEIERVKQGEQKSFSISSGSHEIFVKIPWSWHRSNKIKFDGLKNQKINFSCKSNLRGWKLAFSFFYALFFFNNYIVLEKTS